MKAREIMSSPVETIHADASLDEALTLLEGLSIRHLPVMEGGQLKGLLFDRDLLHETGGLPSRVREIYQDPQKVRVQDVGSLVRMPRLATPDDDALQMILAQVDSREDQADALVVVEEGQPIGIVTEIDILRAWTEAGEPALAGRVEEVMCERVQAITRKTTLGEAREILADLDCHHLPVTAPEGLVGMLSARDVERALGRNRTDAYRIDELMTPQPMTITATASLKEAADRLLQVSVSALPVVNETGVLVGILTTTDLLHRLAAASQTH